jgi:hypothetical protein
VIGGGRAGLTARAPARHAPRLSALAPFGLLLAPCLLALALSACGAIRLPAQSAPPAPVDLSVYVDGRAVSVSPVALGAGPVRVLISSEAPSPVLVLIRRRALTLAQSQRIASGGTGELSVDLARGVYAVSTRQVHEAEAQLGTPSRIAPAALLVGAPRPSANNTLLQP